MTQNLPEIFNRALYLARQKKASGTEILWDRIAEELADRLSLILRRLPKALLIGSQTEALRTNQTLIEKCDHIDWRQAALDDPLDLPAAHYDAIFSLLDLHCINDVPGHLAQLSRALKPDGVLIVAFFAGETLKELRESWLYAETEVTAGVTPRVAPMIGVRELGALMQRAGLALPVADIDHATVRYANVFALMAEIKSFGFSNPLIGRSSKFISRRLITCMAEHYHENFKDEDGRISATLEVAWATAWKPHESQPKPLKPGSATHSLLDALKPKTDQQ
jgi:SAM-dependent methyltransferase